MQNLKRAVPEPLGWIASQMLLCLTVMVLSTLGVDSSLLVFVLMIATILIGRFWLA